MAIEEKLAEYVIGLRYEDLPARVAAAAKNLVLTIIGTTIAGARTQGVDDLLGQVRQWGGREEADVFIYGGRVPAHNAALINSYMARALDFDDGIRPGLHVGATLVPAAFAAAQLAGKVSGREFLSAVVAGAGNGRPHQQGIQLRRVRSHRHPAAFLLRPRPPPGCWA